MASYEGWHHTRYEGDVDAGKALLPLARKVLGFAVEQAAFNGLQTYKHVQQLEGGGEIIGEIIDGIPRVTIYVPTGGEDELPPLDRDDFVVWARDSDRPDGIDADHPQQILSYEDDRWRTVFFNAGIDGYDSFSRRKGTYRGAFPDGVRHAGNVDWASPNGYRVNWYGPSGRMFTDPYVQPRAQFGKFVFMLGQVLLDVDDYIESSEEDDPFPERYVMGAALRRDDGYRWLYTVQADLPEIDTPTDPIPPNSFFWSEQYPQDSIPLIACRYRVAEMGSGAEARWLRVVADSREVLWFSTVARAAQPWFFNPEGTHAVSFSPPAASAVAMQNNTVIQTPSAPDVRFSLDLSGAVGVLSSAAVELAGGNGTSATIARDWDEDGTPVDLILRRSQVDATDGALLLALDDTQWPLLSRQEYSPGISGARRRWLVFADLRERVVVFVIEDYQFSPTAIIDGSVHVEIWRNGFLVGNVQIPGEQYVTTGLPAYTDTMLAPNSNLFPNLRDFALPPSWAIYGIAALVYSTVRIGAWAGAAGAYAYLSAPAGITYGSYGVTGFSSEAPILVSDNVDSGFSGDRIDFDGYYSALGCATGEGITLFSGPPYKMGSDDSTHWVDGDTMPSLTGVGGDNARFHPIWRLGRASNSGVMP